ncbi:MAG: serine/threonine protein kinase, partial [Gemmataceae bacterium]|nr:serine/threonine protein kinase [Gemmataceae bacterium]
MADFDDSKVVFDASSIAQQLLRLHLVTDAQLQECWDELGPGSEPEPLLRCLERKRYLTPYQSHKLLKGDLDGYFLGGHKILYKIASGSFGRVFRAEDPQTGRVVAIKVLRRRWSEDPHAVELFEREGRVGMSLRHPNIVEILNVSQDPATRQYFIVMEFVEGGNLRDILAIRKKLEPADALRIIEDAASGISYAYSRGVTHRDMKLTNILISSQGPAKLVDFGLAGLLRSLGRSEDDGLVDRTVDYAGLEKATGVPAGDIRSDIYFLGCVLSEMLTGRPPLAMTKDPRARMHKQRFDNVTPLRRDEVTAPASVFHLVEAMMSLNPQHRYQTPSQLLEAIRAARRDVEGKAVNRH